jgi:hypothetical protein
LACLLLHPMIIERRQTPLNPSSAKPRQNLEMEVIRWGPSKVIRGLSGGGPEPSKTRWFLQSHTVLSCLNGPSDCKG